MSAPDSATELEAVVDAGTIAVPPMPTPYVATAPPRKPMKPLEDAEEVLRELASYALTILIESCFMCFWGGVVLGVYKVFEGIEAAMPHNTWAKQFFQYAEIGFAVFILCKLFIARAEVFETAYIRARRILRFKVSSD